jgi:tRNA A-37 threonylcarbamoyl transferase component Bud32
MELDTRRSRLADTAGSGLGRPYAEAVVTPLMQIGSYRIERLLGIGSFATVWLGHDASLGARVAIKVLAENWSHDLRVRERFLDEARLLWRLNDSRIVRVHALGELADGRPYLVMAWAEGGSLQDRLAGAPMRIPQALALLREISAGVSVLHDHGIVHRDLTPGNVLFSAPPGAPARAMSAGQVIIADLGLAKALAAASGLTARAGTPGYMAPEQDDPLAIIDRRADVYGLGKLGVRLLGVPGGRRPGEPIRLRDGVPRRVADVLRTATARYPGDRYRDAAAFGLALDRAVLGRSGTAAMAAGRTVMVLASLALTGVLVSDSVSGRFSARPGVAVDPTGHISIELPDGWRAETRQWQWLSGAPTLVLSPDPARWEDDPAVPGAFVGLPEGDRTAADLLAEHGQVVCEAAPVRTSRQAGTQWTIAGYRACPDGRAQIVDAVATRPGGEGLVYVQIAPPANSPPAFVDTLLAGLRVR